MKSKSKVREKILYSYVDSFFLLHFFIRGISNAPWKQTCCPVLKLIPSHQRSSASFWNISINQQGNSIEWLKIDEENEWMNGQMSMKTWNCFCLILDFGLKGRM